MSSGAKYIVENIADIKQDEIIYNRKLLHKKIGEKYCGPLLLWLENTHENFIKKFYKPIIPVAYEFRREIAETGDLNWGTNRFSLQQYGDFTGCIILNIKLSGLMRSDLVGLCGYYDFPAHKLIKNVRLEIGGNTIDEYTGEAYNAWYNYRVSSDKKVAWMRAVGQETVETAYVEHNGYREEKYIKSGYQTAKTMHEDMYINIPILFDCFMRKSAALFSAKIPYGLRFLYIELAQPEDIVYTTTIAPIMPSITGGLIVENIFIEPYIVDKLKQGTYKTFIRVFKEASFSSSLSDIRKLDSLRYPIENLYFGLRPNANTAHDTWWRYHNLNTTQVTFPMHIPPNQLAFYTSNTYRPSAAMSKISFLTKNVEIVREADQDFYSAVQPIYKSTSSSDPGFMLYSFSKVVGKKKTSGAYNVSNERNFYIKYESNTAGIVYILAECLNWLEIDERGTCVLKYNSN